MGYRAKSFVGEKAFDLLFIEDLVEKSLLDDAPPNRGILGGYMLTTKIFDEIQLTDALRHTREKIYAHVYGW